MYNEKKILAIIPARKGSKGIFNKNILPFKGKPLLCHSIDHAKQSNLINRCIVVTDSEEYAEISKKCGAEVPFMEPDEIAQDLSTDLDVFKYSLLWLKQKENYVPDFVVHLRPTSPVRDPKIIDMMITALIENPEADSIRSVILSKQNPYKMWKIDTKEGYLKQLLSYENVKEPYNSPRQILPETYWQNACIDVAKTATILGKNSMTGGKILPFIMESHYDLDIDNSEDIKMEKNKKNDIFDDLFILDMANNHQGSVEHGLNIIKEIAKKVKSNCMKAAIKFQYRQYDSFIHPEFKDKQDIKHIPRFLSTRLSQEECKTMVDEVKRQGLITMCTPFDEESVDVILNHDIDIIKIASCSAQDWPLLERIANANKPVVCSTGGLTIREVDKIVSFFTHRNVNFALMHCVAIYPTKNEDLNLKRIDLLKERYPFLKIGFSSHEEVDNLDAVKMAIAKGAKLLERHIGLETDIITLNNYSSNPEQIEQWFLSAKKAYEANRLKKEIPVEEKESLDSLKRGIYAKKPIQKGQEITKDDVFLAMPLQKGQMPSENFGGGLNLLSHKGGIRKNIFVADKDYEINEPLKNQEFNDIESKTFEAIHEAKGLLYEGRVVIGDEFTVELSHHYGIENFRKVGAIIIDCVNREYCKKLIIQLPNQVHPDHYHKIKEETFQVLYGEMIVNYRGKEKTLGPGEQILVKRHTPHSFSTKTGVIIEEISTTHVKNDSYYLDENILKDVDLRKTKFDLW